MDNQNKQNQLDANNDIYQKTNNTNDGIYAAIGKHESRLDKMESLIKTLMSDNQKMRQHIVHMAKQIQGQKEVIKRLEEKQLQEEKKQREEKNKKEEKRHQTENNRPVLESKSNVVSAPVSGQGGYHATQNDNRVKGGQNTVICPNCGMSVAAGNKFCTNCGSLVNTADKPMNPDMAASAPARTTTPQNNTASMQNRRSVNDQNNKPSQEPNLNFSTGQSSNNQQSHQTSSQQGSFCPNCHAAISAGDHFCIYCGTSLKGQQKHHQAEKPQAETSILQIPADYHEKPYTSNQTQNRGQSSYTTSSDHQFNNESQPENRKNVCPSCGAKTVPGNLFCTECGSRID